MNTSENDKSIADDENEASFSTTENKNSTVSTGIFTIHQNISGHEISSNSIIRSIDKEIFIPRKDGEGIQPLFRDIQTNTCKTPPKIYDRRNRLSLTDSDVSNPDINKNSSKSNEPRKEQTSKQVPYFADEKREQERLQRQNQVLSRTRRERKDTFQRSESHQRYRSRSRSHERSRHRRYSRDRRRRRSSKSYRRSRSRSRSTSRHRSEITPYIPPIMVIATSSTLGSSNDPSNWLQPIVPVSHTIPSQYPPFVRPVASSFSRFPAIPPIRYPSMNYIMPQTNYMTGVNYRMPGSNSRMPTLHDRMPSLHNRMPTLHNRMPNESNYRHMNYREGYSHRNSRFN